MQTVTEILIDFSSSMVEKMPRTKQILIDEVIPHLDFASKMGIKTFSAIGERELRIIENLPLSITNKEVLTNSVQNLGTPNGNTPIAAAIRRSVNTLKEYRAYNKKIVLVTDGEENCGGDYEEEAKQAAREGIECEIHVIGIDLKQEAATKAERLANITKGSFSNLSIGTNHSEPSNVKNQLAPFRNSIVKTTVASHPGSYKPTTMSSAPKQPVSDVVQSSPLSPPKATSLPSENRNDLTSQDQNRSVVGSITNETYTGHIQPEEDNQDLSNGTDSEANKQVNSSGVMVPSTENALSEEEVEADTSNVNEDETDSQPEGFENPGKIEEPPQELSEIKGVLSTVLKELDHIKGEINTLKVNALASDEDDYVEIKENPELNEKIGRASEKLLFDELQEKYPGRVKWLNEDGESGADHDFEILESGGFVEYYIECKGTSTDENFFLLTKNEWRLFLNHTGNYQIYFVKNVLDNPSWIPIHNLQDWLSRGKVVPYLLKSSKIKGERIPLTILE